MCASPLESHVWEGHRKFSFRSSTYESQTCPVVWYNLPEIQGIHLRRTIETYIVQVVVRIKELLAVRLKGKCFYSALLFAFIRTVLFSPPSAAQVPNPTSTQGQGEGQVQMRDGVAYYKVQVVDRTLPAINYFHRSGETKIAFVGTPLLPNAKGEAKVNAHSGRTSIDADFDNLSPANGFGPEYLTYVLWAITPEGRPVNLGEVLPTGSKDRNHITVTTNLQTFGLMVTAEPYFAVTMPSDLVVAQNIVLKNTSGIIEPVTAHYTLLPRGAYTETAGRHTVLHPITRKEKTPLEVYEAENAVMIAQAAGADKYAPETMEKAKSDLENAENLNLHKHDTKQAITYAREAVQASEDARIVTIRKLKAEDEEAQRAARVQAEQNAQEARQQAQQAQQQAEQAQQAQQQAAQAQQEAAQRAQAEAAQRARAEAAAAAAQAQAEKARQAQQEAEQRSQQLAQQEQQARERLRSQLNAVLETRETARGLIMEMPDVLFDFNKYTLKPTAREKLAKVSGILLAYPDLKVQVEGYTDSIGSEEYNQKLSEQRADSVKDYLASQNVRDSNITAEGLGKSDPIADNSTASGRAKNRRVELVVSGAAIGVQEQQPATPGGESQNVAPQQAPPPAQPVTPAKPTVPDTVIPQH
jgi:outer membrane protein OmpA-like peptidoglycan-associated protein